MKAATNPIQRAADAKLLVVDSNGQLTHVPRAALAHLLSPGDLLVANDAATLPASLRGIHLPTGRAIEVRLAGYSRPTGSGRMEPPVRAEPSDQPRTGRCEARS